MITAEQMTEKFVKDGWNRTVSFTEITLAEAKETGCMSMVDKLLKGHQFFKMAVSGNIFDENGNIFLYNIKPRTESK